MRLTERVPAPKSASKTCTAVVKMTGASQFSERILLLHVSFSGVRFEWCSSSEISPRRLQDLANNVGVLVNNGRVRADIDHTFYPSLGRVVKGEAQAGECLAPAGGNGQGENPLLTI
jgi:hypothetical protein